MGRFESQRAIAARTISERRRGSKHSGGGRWGSWFTGRTTALALTCAGLILLAQYKAPAAPASPPPSAPRVETKFGKAPFAAKLTAAAAQAAPVQRAGRSAARRPSTSPPAAPEPGYQVLSPDELAAISQAR